MRTSIIEKNTIKHIHRPGREIDTRYDIPRVCFQPPQKLNIQAHVPDLRLVPDHHRLPPRGGGGGGRPRRDGGQGAVRFPFCVRIYVKDCISITVPTHHSPPPTPPYSAITPTPTGLLAVSVERAASSPSDQKQNNEERLLLSCACVLLATGSDRKGHAMAESLGHAITAPVPSLFTFELGGKGKSGDGSNPLHGLAGISVGVVEVRLLGPAGGGAGGAKGFKEVG